jgi:hypothetical protein
MCPQNFRDNNLLRDLSKLRDIFQVVFFCLAVVSVTYARPQFLYAPVAPQPVADTPEVASAKVAHFAAWNAAAAAAAAAPDYGPVPVAAPFISAYAAPGAYVGPYAGIPAIVNGVPADTPEVAAAKVAHFAAHAQARALLG